MTTSICTAGDSFFMDPILYSERPADGSYRLPREIRAYDLLDWLGIPYQRLDHAPTATIKDCHNVDKRLDIEICENLFLCNTQKTDFYLLMVPGSKKFKAAALSKQIRSARLSFADPEFMLQFLDITPGSVSVLDRV